MNKAFLRLHNFQISESELTKLSLDQQATFALFCYAVSEVNCLQRLSLFSNDVDWEEPEIVAASGIQTCLLLRTISSKLFELRELLTFYGKYNKTKDADLLEFGRRAKKRFQISDAHEGFEVAKRMRHEATFHYQLKPTRTRILDVPDDAIRSLYMHETPGNQFFPYGEEAIFVSMLDEIAKESDKSMVAGDVIKAWAEWTLEAIRAANDLFSDFFVSFVEPHTNGRKPKEASYWLDPSLVGTVGEYKTPVFVRQE